MSEKWLIFGGTGMLGSALVRELNRFGLTVITAARSNADYLIDMTDYKLIRSCLEEIKPNRVINCAAITNERDCCKNPGFARQLNSLSLEILSTTCARIDAKLIQISTDAFYHRHYIENTEANNDLKFPTIYSSTKYEAEQFCSNKDLIIRTTFIGRNDRKSSLLDFFVRSLVSGTDISVYSDAITSSLDVRTCASLIVSMGQSEAAGIYNLGTAFPYSKAELYYELMRLSNKGKIPKELRCAQAQEYKANPSQGMNCKKITDYLGCELPSLKSVITLLKTSGDLDDLL
ncbi:sugar nucleotide-binding protein [Lentibacter algarum]|uniref:sugar nucleotide-binding protein n=1 Tax=Lentibacter algarum TaxID=576131 RepID=UPI00339D808C